MLQGVYLDLWRENGESMAMSPIKILSIILLAASSSAFADEAGRAAAKGFAHDIAKPAAAKEASMQSPGPGRMQVDEPASANDNPDQRDSKAWQKSHAKGLTEEQRAAFRERKDKMEGMIALIKAKRKALQEAKPEERAALARELHSLILEKDSDPSDVASAASVRNDDNGGSPASSTSSTSSTSTASQADAQKTSATQKASEDQSKRREEIRERQLERMKKAKAKDGDD
jgi:hypothetical protein